ncbi:GPI transamidase component PIG-T homolog isoform X1 [Nymphaea colorata]|nr:GPI transamidase component PIG-T homolog isoform X1 [Nymphaea colorata]
MAVRCRFSFVVSSIFFLLLSCCLLAALKEEEFTEELLLRPLRDQKVLAHFHFTSRVPLAQDYGHHHRLFPKAIYQLVQKFRVREMELSFTQGRWNYERWGGYDYMSASNAKPPGVELWAVLDAPADEIETAWRNLTHALSGLFCASINFLESTTSYAFPNWSFKPDRTHNLRYGALPREAVCTENLTPWLKLLPCRDKAGIAEIMDRQSIYRGFYHSQRLYISSSEFDLGAKRGESGTFLEQTLTLVLQPSMPSAHFSEKIMQPSWSIGSLFGKQITGRCVLAKSSNVFLELEGDLVKKLESVAADIQISSHDGTLSEQSWRNPVFELSSMPDGILRGFGISKRGVASKLRSVVYKFSVKNSTLSIPLNVGMTWKQPIIWNSCQAPFHSSRFLMGSGNARGSLAISLESTLSTKKHLTSSCCAIMGSNQHDNTAELMIFQIVPWYVKVYFHTLQVYIDGHLMPVSDIVKRISVSPSVDRVTPGLMEILLVLPHNSTSAALILDFDKGFLHIDEYPPDANQGFDLPSALISFPGFKTSTTYHEQKLSAESPLLHKLQEVMSSQLYTEVLLVPLATPDFSMPYNVITLTCTMLALYFGSLLNVLRRRVGEEKRYLKSKAALKGGLLVQMLSKLSTKVRGRSQEAASSPSLMRRTLFRVILVAIFAVALHYFLNN